MTLYLRPDHSMTNLEKWQAKQDIANILRQLAVQYLGTAAVDLREPVVGSVEGTGTITTAETGIPVDVETGEAVDLLINGTAGTNSFNVGWTEVASAITANELSQINATAQAQSPKGKILAFFGVIDLTSVGDLTVLDFESGHNRKVYVDVESIYEPDDAPQTGGYFWDDQLDAVGGAFYGLTSGQQEPMTINGIWETSANKLVKLRSELVEKKGNVINASGEQAAIVAVPASASRASALSVKRGA